MSFAMSLCLFLFNTYFTVWEQTEENQWIIILHRNYRVCVSVKSKAFPDFDWFVTVPFMGLLHSGNFGSCLEIHEDIYWCLNSLEAGYVGWVAPRSRHAASTFHMAFWTRHRTKHTFFEAQIFILWFSPFSIDMHEITPIMRLKNSYRLRF